MARAVVHLWRDAAGEPGDGDMIVVVAYLALLAGQMIGAPG
jgi:hypothetical protein